MYTHCLLTDSSKWKYLVFVFVKIEWHRTVQPECTPILPSLFWLQNEYSERRWEDKQLLQQSSAWVTNCLASLTLTQHNRHGHRERTEHSARQQMFVQEVTGFVARCPQQRLFVPVSFESTTTSEQMPAQWGGNPLATGETSGSFTGLCGLLLFPLLKLWDISCHKGSVHTIIVCTSVFILYQCSLMLIFNSYQSRLDHVRPFP